MGVRERQKWQFQTFFSITVQKLKNCVKLDTLQGRSLGVPYMIPP